MRVDGDFFGHFNCLLAHKRSFDHFVVLQADQRKKFDGTERSHCDRGK